MKYYVLLVEEDVEPRLLGPFDRDFLRDDKARDLKSEHGDEHGIYALDVADDGTPETFAYTRGFFLYPTAFDIIERLRYYRGTERGNILLALYEQAEIVRVEKLMALPEAFFVFGSNLAGRHGAGAARVAREKYGALPGLGFGLQGRAMALPTKDQNLNTLPLDRIKHYVDRFIDVVVRSAPTIPFATTRIGCGLAGFHDEDIAPLFKDAPRNLYLPQGWREFNGEKEEPV